MKFLHVYEQETRCSNNRNSWDVDFLTVFHNVHIILANNEIKICRIAFVHSCLTICIFMLSQRSNFSLRTSHVLTKSSKTTFASSMSRVFLLETSWTLAIFSRWSISFNFIVAFGTFYFFMHS